MSTKATLSHHTSETTEEPSWHLYEEVFEPGVVYLELEGIPVDFTTLGNMEHRAGTVMLRLPIKTAQQLGLHTTVPPDRWASLRAEEQ
ncbi:hypothetical protein [Caballeronia sp. AZ7_KS35]|uniref:hypothetical protein n=1 Tax=Caballeronia sp. AZ7_KS35 TaxID=2921762 RepID=UPI0020291C47|nr:hypothetical protein [Caballeronia sp. AZ7_KS35]